MTNDSRRWEWRFAALHAPGRRPKRLAAACGVMLGCCLTIGGRAQPPFAPQAAVVTLDHRPDRVLVMPKRDVAPAVLGGFHTARNIAVLRAYPGIGGLQVVRVPEGETVQGLIARYEQSGLAQFAEPDYRRRLALTPDDPSYANGTLWGLNNYGQSAGTVDADIDAPEGWDVLTSASNIVVAVLDTGIRRTHEDLAANVWTNAGGYGWNALTGTGAPADDEGHGSLVAGVLGAVGNNGKGVVGVAWQVQIMAGKCFDAQKNGYDSDIIECLEFARANGARIVNASFGFTNYSQALSNAIHAARNAGILLVASAGNDALNVDAKPQYPACYDIDNIVVVAATTRDDGLWSGSNHGATNVDLAAPGAAMYSTFFAADNSYLGGSYLAGTSLAAPYVSGTLALMRAKYPAETHQQIIRRLLAATDPRPALAGNCVTGGRLNLRNALSPPIQLTVLSAAGETPFQLRVSGGPNRSCVIESSTNLAEWSSVFTNVTSAEGTFDYADAGSHPLSLGFYRATASP